ncbi:MAG: hypothetical protein RIF41_10190 [Polyangiaceae bacterium]
MSVQKLQRSRLSETIRWAKEIQAHLQPIVDANEGQVHFRPSSGGVAMVGLTPERPQRGKSGIRDLQRLAGNFEEVFSKHCVDVEHGRPTAEKSLQSWMIAEAYRTSRRMVSLNRASQATEAPVELVFVTDEIALPTTTDGKGRIVCDILALRAYIDGIVPVIIELKTERQLTRLVEQVTTYATLVDEHTELFAELFAATLGTTRIATMDPCERWIVWPRAGEERDPREDELAAVGIRVVGYEPAGNGYAFRVGRTLAE